MTAPKPAPTPTSSARAASSSRRERNPRNAFGHAVGLITFASCTSVSTGKREPSARTHPGPVPPTSPSRRHGCRHQLLRLGLAHPHAESASPMRRSRSLTALGDPPEMRFPRSWPRICQLYLALSTFVRTRPQISTASIFNQSRESVHSVRAPTVRAKPSSSLGRPRPASRRAPASPYRPV
jgi:hypothetical protein